MSGRQNVAHCHARGAVAPTVARLEARIRELEAELAELKANAKP